MKKAVADTSALVSLSFSGQLAPASKALHIFVPMQVKKELEEIAAFADEKAAAAKEALSIIKSGAIQAKTVDAKKAEALVNKNVDFGEAECFQLATEREIPVMLMDDLNAGFALEGMAKARGISIKISAAAVVELANRKQITKKTAKESLLKMVKRRNWEKTTLEYLIHKYFP
ncbi:MAG: hypothetical protein AABW99_05455 [archaeon]